MDLATNLEAFWTGAYIGVLVVCPVALWAMCLAIINRSIS